MSPFPRCMWGTWPGDLGMFLASVAIFYRMGFAWRAAERYDL